MTATATTEATVLTKTSSPSHIFPLMSYSPVIPPSMASHNHINDCSFASTVDDDAAIDIDDVHNDDEQQQALSIERRYSSRHGGGRSITDGTAAAVVARK